MDNRYRRTREEALSTPFICLSDSERASSAWKVRILRQDYCGLLTFKSGEPTKCTYCLAHKPYFCSYKVTKRQLLYERLFK